MKAWTTAGLDGICAFDRTHQIATGDRVGVVQGATWRKVFCAMCARTRHGFPEDTGELLEVDSAPGYPQPLRELAVRGGERFDARMAAAGGDRD